MFGLLMDGSGNKPTIALLGFLMIFLIALAIAGLSLYKCWRRPGSKRGNEGQRQKELRKKIKNGQRLDADLHWYDRTWCCCFCWPLLWKGRFSNTFCGSVASVQCRLLRCVCSSMAVLFAMAGVGLLLEHAQRQDPLNRTVAEVWEAAAQERMRELSLEL